jgi:aminoglycoside phosphotransferase family enzyme/predicted kinase
MVVSRERVETRCDLTGPHNPDEQVFDMALAQPSPRVQNKNTMDQARLVAALANPARFGPACTSVTVLETHISYVLLTDKHAYKLKKAVDLGFLDFTTLASRRFFCEQELRLNRRLAPELYLDVVAITGTIDEPVIDGKGPVLEYAVKMREFPQDALASRVLDRNELGVADIDMLAAKVAAFHATSQKAAADSTFGAPETILRAALANCKSLLAGAASPAERRTIEALHTWTEREHAARNAAFRGRREGGFVRECHGDLHLGNIAVIDGEVTIFDCIEFNEQMRWIDVMSEVAFTAMDLQDRGHAELAHRFVNAYLEITGDYAGLSVLRFYLVYRALVRAKIALLRAIQLPPGEARAPLYAERDGYLRLAEAYARSPEPAILITHGITGCGKTTLSQALLEQIGAIRIRTDVERKRLHGLAPTARSDAATARMLYGADATRRTYDHVLHLAASVAAAGFVAIVDGTFLRRWQRDRFRRLAAELGIPFVIVAFSASEGVLRRRVAERARRGTDASDADVAVLEHQLGVRQSFGADEVGDIVTYDAAAPLADARSPHAWSAVIDRIGALRRVLVTN